MKKTDKKFHIEHEEFQDGYNGQGQMPLEEPVPVFTSRPGDASLSAAGFEPGTDNNTIIIFGRDRDAFRRTKEGLREKPGNNPLDVETVSGYSNYMGAGAIDIIVGRGAPYSVPGVKSYPNSLPPLYLTKTDSDLKAVSLRDGELHPGYVMDAARIYTSQMCDIDEYFAIKTLDSLKVDQGPSSAIILKADRLRLHSRRDIKIVAGGDKGTEFDSNGFRIKERGRIHLMAGNGEYGGQQPIPLGDNLVECLGEVLESIQSTLSLLDNFMTAQKEVNAAVAKHVHASGAGMTTWDPLVEAMCFNADLTFMQDQTQLLFEKTTNILSITGNYLTSGGPKFINSYYTTTT